MLVSTENTARPEFLTKLLCDLPRKYTYAYSLLSEAEKQSLSEIRIRAECPCSFTCKGVNVPMRDGEGKIIKATVSEIEEILEELCDGSVYAYARQMKEGYIPYNGTRIGIGGTGFGGLEGLRNITSLSVRIPIFREDAADKALSYIKEKGLPDSMGIIAVSPPNMGKTTFLRALARGLSESCGLGVRVCLLDERGELADPDMTGDCLCDVLSGIPKTTAIEMAIRSLSPQVIVLDEIGSNREAELLESAFSGGVYVATSIHGNGISDVLRYSALGRALKHGIIKTAYLLKGPEHGWGGDIVDLSEYGKE